ncbi:MFS transporter [Zhongshania aliphaticivorans]|uniref:MFS transporter n=1 Tax=Zhongshania aliphaticivorans TaxID=1470434 RepID=A0A127M9Y8_9GAMM|nr:MFS transporter [Zhongshania aliphaticivorans]AMO70040.1 MFS transporter [Zhongshania aliphaticivorans]|tara:strand:- start:48136 stop:49443 length:1308 start_codon:yes stop_codon:yes gene_type:complete
MNAYSELEALNTLNDEPMNKLQWYIVAICIGILALDGYDVLSIAFAAPGLAAEWGLSKDVLGIVLSLELLGMAVGAIIMGSLTDSHGRRPIMLSGLVILTVGMLIAGIAPNIYVLGAARVFTGIGIGGLMATATATSSDFCNARNRALAVTLVAGGFAFGVYLGASFLAPLLKHYSWRVTFYLGASVSFIFIPLVYFLVPESISYLERKRPEGALKRIQKTMIRLGHTPPKLLVMQSTSNVEPMGVKNLFKDGLLLPTSILLFGYLGNIGTYYYFVKWTPTIVADLGYSASEAIAVLGVVSLGGVLGSIGISILSRYFSIRKLMAFSLISAALGVALFPHFNDSLASMKQIGFFAGVFILAAISGFFGLFAATYPSSLLGSGSGLVLGIGRGGAVLGPMIPGFLFVAGFPLATISLTMAAGSFFAGLAVLFLSTK